MPTSKLRVAIVGCGDVLYRSYLPPLAALVDRAEIVGCASRTMRSAELAAEAVGGWSPDVVAFDDLDRLLESTHPDAVFNLTPGPAHAEVTAACLEAGDKGRYVNLKSTCERPAAIPAGLPTGTLDE